MRKRVVFPVTLLLAGALALPSLGAAEEEGSSKGTAKKDPVYASKAEILKIAGELQFRFTHVEASGDSGAAGDSVSSFGFKRARLAFVGDLTENLYYQMKFQFDNLPLKAAAAKGDGAVAFNTTFLGYRLGPIGNVAVGRFDVPTTPRSNSSGQAFAERPFHVEQNYPGGQLGIMWDNNWWDDRINLNLGVFNGDGDTVLGNNNNGAGDHKFLYGGRFTFSPMKGFEFEKESDLKNSNWGVGILLGAWTNKEGARGTSDNSTTVVAGTTTTVTASTKFQTTSAGAALSIKGKGLCLLADYTHKKVKFGQGTDSSKTTPTGTIVTGLGEYLVKGWSAQASYAIPIKKIFIEPKIRYERYWDPSNIDSATGELAAPANNTKVLAKEANGASGNFAWTTVGFNVWLKSNSFINVDYVFKREMGDVPSVNNNTLLVQANHYF